MRVEEVKDSIRNLCSNQEKLEELNESINFKVDQMNSDVTEAFRYKIMDDMNTKYLHLKIEAEKRE